MKPASVGTAIAAIKSRFGWLMKAGFISENPTAAVSISKAPKAMGKQRTTDLVSGEGRSLSEAEVWEVVRQGRGCWGVRCDRSINQVQGSREERAALCFSQV